ncbi:MAG: hypothetical protein ACTSX7_12750, partial [Alphaproteobacteria bacterium]
DRDNVPSSRSREIALQLLVELAAPEPPAGQGSRLASVVPGRVIDARLKDPFTEEVIYTYGTLPFDAAATPEPSSPVDPWDHFPMGGFDELLVAQARQVSGAGSDAAFQVAYASERACQAVTDVAGNDFAVARIAGDLQPEFAERIAAVAAGDAAPVRFLFQQSLGAYDFAKQAYTFDVTTYQSKILSPSGGRISLQPSCNSSRQQYPVTRFFIGIEGQAAIRTAGVPMAPDVAESLISRLDTYKRVGLEILTQLEPPSLEDVDPRYGGRYRDSSATAQIIDARIVALDTGDILHLYGPSLFGANVQAGPASDTGTPLADSPTDLEGEPTITKKVQALPSLNAGAETVNVEDIGKVALQTSPTANNPPATPTIVDLSKLGSPPQQSADARAADEFQILNVTVGMSEAEVLAAIAEEFSPDQVSIDPAGGTIFAERGACNYADPTDPSILAEVGSFCLAVQLTDGAVNRVALRQVVPGDVSGPALAAFQSRYGDSVFLDKGIAGAGTTQTLIGWGQPAGAERSALGRVPSATPTTVLEGNIWQGNDVSTIVLRLDKTAPPPEPAPSAAIKF